MLLINVRHHKFRKFSIKTNNFWIFFRPRWYSNKFIGDICLFGTIDENEKGTLYYERQDKRLSRIYYWKEVALYQHKINIPEAWKNKRIVFYPERTKNVKFGFDDQYCVSGESLSAPDLYDLRAAISLNKYKITNTTDSSKLPPIWLAHAN